eukprot:scaffold2642_cov120-Cylindrotheca_fusiformis.AAC.5
MMPDPPGENSKEIIACLDERFTVKLHRILEDAENEGFQNIMCWNPGGRSFSIHQPRDFVSIVMPRYFRQTKYKSFQRQLNLYGFTREVKDGVRGASNESQGKFVNRPYFPPPVSPPFIHGSINQQRDINHMGTSYSLDAFPPFLSSRPDVGSQRLAEEALDTSRRRDSYDGNGDDDDSMGTIEGHLCNDEEGALYDVARHSI